MRNVGTKIGYTKCDDETIRRIVMRREELRMSQAQLATLLGYTSRTTISRFENGTLPLHPSKIYKFAVALQTTPEYLLHLTDDVESVNADKITEETTDPVVSKLIAYCKQLQRKEQEMLLDFAELIIKYKKC